MLKKYLALNYLSQAETSRYIEKCLTYMRVSFKSVHKFVTETHCKLKRLNLNERRLDLIKKLSKADYGLGIIALEHPTLAVSIRRSQLGPFITTA